MVSTFQPSRRHDVGLEAFARLRAERPGARWVLVGDGALLPEVRAQVEARGLAGAVTFAGYRSGPDFVRWLQALDEVWVLGLGNDWSGRVAAQARACGVRVVAVDEGGLAPNADALLPAADPAQLVAASLGASRAAQPLPSNAETAGPGDRALREVPPMSGPLDCLRHPPRPRVGAPPARALAAARPRARLPGRGRAPRVGVPARVADPDPALAREGDLGRQPHCRRRRGRRRW